MAVKTRLAVYAFHFFLIKQNGCVDSQILLRNKIKIYSSGLYLVLRMMGMFRRMVTITKWRYWLEVVVVNRDYLTMRVMHVNKIM